MSEALVGFSSSRAAATPTTAVLPSPIPLSSDKSTQPSTQPSTSTSSTSSSSSPPASPRHHISTSSPGTSASSSSSSSSASSSSSSSMSTSTETPPTEPSAQTSTESKHESSSSPSSPSSPITNFKIESGHHSEQGTRPTMEDEVLICDSFDVAPSSANSTSTSTSSIAVTSPLSFYGVFDGHGGKQAAVFTREHIHHNIIKQLQQGKNPADALTQAYLQTDQEFIEQCRDTSGTTAVCILIEHSTRRLWVANVGDSRAVLCRKGTVLALTRDHKADRPDEVERIRKAGGFVVHKRVMGELAISRAIGDIDFKEKGFLFVLADPEISEHLLSSDDEFVLIACDGLYDVMSNEAACEFIRNSFRSGATPDQAASQIVQHAISQLHTRDNVTVVIVRLKQPQVIALVNSQEEQQQDLKEEIVVIAQNQATNT